MGNSSDGDEDEDLMDFTIDENGKKRPLSPESIGNIIGSPLDKPNKKHAPDRNKNPISKQAADKANPSTLKNTEKTTNNDKPQKSTFKSSTNISLKMKEITNKKYKNLFYINTKENTSRLQMSDIWTKVSKKSNDVILQTKKGFLIKSNTDQRVLIQYLDKLKTEQKINSFEKTTEKERQQKSDTAIASYSAVIATVELEIEDKVLSEHLNKIGIEHRYCKRIVSRKTGNNTYLIRIITGNIKSFERLLNEGLFYKNRHYPVYTSLPPLPAPLPCGRCHEFTHKTEDCSTPQKCNKCQGSHSTSKCTTQLPVRCSACNAEDHAAWSFKCPKRPKSALPNIPIKSINKKSQEIESDLKKESRIHSSITKHDFIIHTYIDEVNNPKNNNREEIIQKIRKKFIDLWNIDTAAVFTQNRLYILMFDLETDFDSPTEPLPSPNNRQCNI